MNERRLLVCGGRDFNDWSQLHRALGGLHFRSPLSALIEGEAPGADSLARDWAQLHHVPVIPFFAEWNLFGSRAGAIRNSRMLRDGKPTFAMAFPGGTGTADMIAKLRKAGIPTYVGRWANPGDLIRWELCVPKMQFSLVF